MTMSGTRRKPGRLGPYVEGYRARLLELGYTPGTVRGMLKVLGQLGRWMESAGVEAGQLDEAAIGAFLVGIALSGPIAEKSHRLLAPLRDLFAAAFFFFFGLEIDPASLPPQLPLAAGLALITGVTKLLTGYWAAGRIGAYEWRWTAAATGRNGVEQNRAPRPGRRHTDIR